MKRLSQLIAIGVIAAAAAFVVLFAVKPVEVKAEGHADHCICGGTDSCLAATANNGHQALKPTDGWTEVTTETELRGAITAGSVGGHVFVYLGNDITMTGSGHISTSSRKVHLCLNGHTLTSAKSSRIFAIYKSDDNNNYPGNLTITDCSSNEAGKITAAEDATGPSGQGGLIYNSSSGTLEIYAGTIQNGRTSGNNPGGCISCRGSSTFKMYGGTIKGGRLDTSLTAYGGNVEIQGKASGTMYGGTISGGKANRGGNLAVYDTGSSFTMKGGTIEGGIDSDYNSSTYGGNVVIIGAGTFTMDDGTITEGRSGSYGGNVSVSGASATFTMNGGTINNGKGGTIAGNVYVQGKFNMKGGRIENGSSGNKTGTTSSNQGHNIYIDTAGAVTIEGNSLITNTIPSSNSKYDIYGTKTLVIKGSPVFNVTSGDTCRSICMSGGNATLSIDGGSFIGNIYLTKGAQGTINGGTFVKNLYAGTESSSTGHFEINGGFFGLTVAPTTSAPGTVTINGGYFKNKPVSTAENANMTYNPDLWTIDDDPRIPFSCWATFTKVDGTTGYLQMNYAVTKCKQITGRNMTLNENLSLGIYLNVDLAEPLYKNEDGVGKLTVELNGVTKEAELTDLTSAGTGTYAFFYDGVTPDLMGDTITVTLYGADGTSVLDTKTYTIKEYLTELQGKTAAELEFSDAKKAALDTLITDLLVYGREAQKKFDHNTEALVIAETETGSGREPSGNIADIWNKTTVTAANYQDASVVPGFFKEATVIHENINWIRVKYIDNAADDGTTFTAMTDGGTETAVTLDNGYLCTDGLKASEYGTRFIFRAYRGSEVISKVEYSMNSYCVRKHTDPGHEFSDALYNYGASAAAFATAE